MRAVHAMQMRACEMRMRVLLVQCYAGMMHVQCERNGAVMLCRFK